MPKRAWLWLVVIAAWAGDFAMPTLHGRDAVARFDGRVARITIGGADVSIGVESIGRVGAMHRAQASDPVLVDGELRRAVTSSAVEWWRSDAHGLEHGITIDGPPRGTGALVIDLAVPGRRPHELSSGAIALDRVALYSGLAVLDARGERIEASMHPVDGRIRIEIDDEAARYPIVVDPTLTAMNVATLSDPSMPAEFGIAVAVSADGTRAIIGAQGYSSTVMLPGSGEADVFVLTGTSWTLEARLNPSMPVANGLVGGAVAISADGSTAIAGGGGCAVGGLHVFVRSGTTWSEQTTLHPGPNGCSGVVALSDDGQRIAVGAWQDDVGALSGAGQAYVYVRSGTTWTLEATLAAPDAAAGDAFGDSIDIASDGSRIVVGVPYDGSNVGSARVFVRSGSTWAQEAVLVGASPVPRQNLGASVGLGGDGVAAIVGTTDGRAIAFARSGVTWTQEASLTDPYGNVSDFGRLISLSADGAWASIGGSSGSRQAAPYLYQRAAGTWTLMAMTPSYYRLGSALGGGSVASGGGTVVVGNRSNGTAYVYSQFVAASSHGASCTQDQTCQSGYCVDQVCCDTACGRGLTTDCMACSTNRNGSSNGTCTPLVAAAAASTVCRSPTGPCDLADHCSTSNTACLDVRAAGGTVCRAASGPCDAPELCDGSTVMCPMDVPSASGTVCRASAGSCDVAEACDGTNRTCPGDTFLPSGSVCGTGMGDCAMPTTCTGTMPMCPTTAGVRASGTLCRISAGPCDVNDFCDGASSACPDAVQPATTACGSLPSGVCDLPDHCSGMTSECVAVYANNVVCRASSGACDVAEVCSGTSADCPPDGLLPSGVDCRPSTSVCDPAEVCDGTTNACPPDVNACMATPDAGTSDASVLVDAGPADATVVDAASVGRDAGTTTADGGAAPPPAMGSCGCRAAGRSTPTMPLAIMLAGIAWLRVTRRRARRAREIGSARA